MTNKPIDKAFNKVFELVEDNKVDMKDQVYIDLLDSMKSLREQLDKKQTIKIKALHQQLFYSKVEGAETFQVQRYLQEIYVDIPIGLYNSVKHHGHRMFKKSFDGTYNTHFRCCEGGSTIIEAELLIEGNEFDKVVDEYFYLCDAF